MLFVTIHPCLPTFSDKKNRDFKYWVRISINIFTTYS
jgi:hypothetical protein